MAEMNLMLSQYPSSDRKPISREERNRKLREKLEKEKQLTAEIDELNKKCEEYKKIYTTTKVGSIERKNCYDEVRKIMNQISNKREELASL